MDELSGSISSKEEGKIVTYPPGRQGIVWKACDMLWTKGIPVEEIKKPNVTKCIEDMGYPPGNPNQTYKYLYAWREARGLSKPEPLSDPLNQVVAQLRENLRNEANERINDIQAQSEQKIELLSQKLHLLEQHLEQAQSVIISLKEKHENDQKAIHEVSQKAQELENENNVLREKAQFHEKYATQAKEDSQKTIENMEQNHSIQTKELKTQVEDWKRLYRDDTDAYKNLLENHRHEWMVANDKLKTANMDLEKEKQVLLAKLELSQKDFDKFQQEHKLIKNQLSQLEHDHHREHLKSSLLEQEISSLTKQNLYLNELVSQKNEQSELYHLVQSYQDTLSGFDTKLTQIQNDLKKAQDHTSEERITS